MGALGAVTSLGTDELGRSSHPYPCLTLLTRAREASRAQSASAFSLAWVHMHVRMLLLQEASQL